MKSLFLSLLTLTSLVIFAAHETHAQGYLAQQWKQGLSGAKLTNLQI